MKHFKKLASLLLATIMVFGLAATALATTDTDPEPTPAYQHMEGTLTGGSITINNAVVGNTYSIYQLMYVDSQSEDENNISYKANTHWDGFLRSDAANPYVSVSTNGYVTWHYPDNMSHDDAVIKFAKLALDYAKDNSITPVATQDVTSNEEPEPNTVTLTFPGLMMGYYLVDSTVGTLLSLDTNNDGEGKVWEKNTKPTNEKQVQEDNDNGWGSSNDAQVGDTVNFRSTVTLPKGSERVVYHDTMSPGLTLIDWVDNATVENPNPTPISEWGIKVYSDEAMTDELDLGTDYTISIHTNYDPGANPDPHHPLSEHVKYENNHCTFEVIFSQTYLDLPIGTGDTDRTETVYIKYSATINENAVIGVDGNTNSSQLKYGHDGEAVTTPSITKTYVWAFNILKYGDGDKTKKLAGAEFVLLDKADQKNIKVAIFESKTQDTVTYNMIKEWKPLSEITQDDIITWPTEAILTTDDQGTVNPIGGLDSVDTYYLREIKAPAGYNLLETDKDFQVTPPTEENPTVLTIEVNNNSGAEMPSTGGIGTTIFYVVGSILLVGAVVLLVVKKRMSVSK